ncbi:MAG: MFS transporter [Candidatus Calescibacterium sp.]|nr:MFS transporter [Candidatus Calescibacterium sp.]MDW8133285.1 MFS transporter [Candidatus Calescibacterium sp.]
MRSFKVFNSVYIVIFLFGLVSFFGDIVYEGAKSILGQYMFFLGASAFAIGLVAGLGEFISFAFRIFFGYLADIKKSYWIMVIIGYGLLISVSLIYFASVWQMVALFFLLERLGKAIRTPSRDFLVSVVSSKFGIGKTFGIHEFIDQLGAIIGPALLGYILLIKGYKEAFLFLFIPAFLCLLLIFYTKFIYDKNVGDFFEQTRSDEKFGFNRYFYLYLLSSFFIALGYSDFVIIAYHVKVNSLTSDSFIPLIYSLAMFVDAVFALFFGFWYDRNGKVVILLGFLGVIVFPFLVFSTSFWFLIIGVVLWSIGKGLQESVLKAGISNFVKISGKSFGMFYFFYGLGCFLGSSIIGYLYEISIYWVMFFSFVSQLIAVFILYYLTIKV